MHFLSCRSYPLHPPAAHVRVAAILALFALSLALQRPAVAQSATTGAIGGTVSDASGASLPGATVNVTSVSTGTTRTIKSNSSGEFLVPELDPGQYTVTFTAEGFETFEQSSVLVTVGSISTVTSALKPGAVTNKVEVTAEESPMHTEDSTISTTIDTATIDNLPMHGERWSDFARLTPGVVSNLDGYGLLSFRGISFLLNNNTVDGADDNQAYYSEARGRTRTAYTISPSAIQEFQVNTSNYSAQYGRSAGGVINTVTKSGGNDFHGELFFYDRDVDLGGATDPYTLLTEQQSNGDYASVPTKPTDWRKQWGFGAGGRLIRDKLFWFYSYDEERRNFPFDSRPNDPSDVFAPSNPTLPAGETCSTSSFTTSNTLSVSTGGDYSACEIAAMYGVSYQVGSAYYTQGLGILQSFTGMVPRTQDQVSNLPKLDWQINERNHLSLMYDRMRYSSPNGLYSQSSYSEGPSGLGQDNVKEDFGIARLTTVLSNSMVNEALVQYGRDFEYTYQDHPLPNELPMANNSFGAAASTQIGYYQGGGIYAGSNPDLPRYADPDERRLQLLDSVTWSHGKHSFKFGLEYNKVSDYVNNLYNGNGSFSYDWAYGFIADYLNLTTGLGGPVSQNTSCTKGAGQCYNQQYYDYSQEFGNPAGLIATREYAGYATDDWRFSPRLTLTLGVRYEYEYVPQNPFVNTGNPALAAAVGSTSIDGAALPQTADRPDDRDNIAPRFGFAWNIFGNNKTILRGGYGMYYGRIVNSNILQTFIDSGATNGQLEITDLHPPSDNNGCGPQWPNLAVSAASIYSCYAANGGIDVSSVAYFDPHFRNPKVHEADLAIERDLGHNMTLGVTYMLSLGRELPTAIDTNLSSGGVAYAPYAVSPATPVTSFCISPDSECATSLAAYPQLQPTSGYVPLPHGGSTPPPLPAGYMGKFFLLASPSRPNPDYYEILDVKSAVNSSYNAFAVQLDRRYEKGFSLLTNFTWSHALDENPYESTVVPGETFLDPTNARSAYGNSNTDVRLRYVGALIYQPQTHFKGIENQVLGGWRIAPLVQIQTGLPFTPTISTTGLKSVAVPGSGIESLSISSDVNGSGSSAANRPPWIDRNSFNYPKTAVVDMRLTKNFILPETAGLKHIRLEFLAELFNVLNHQNITGVDTEAYTLTDGTGDVPTLSPYPGFGLYTNSNSNYTYSPRQLQVAVRLHF